MRIATIYGSNYGQAERIIRRIGGVLELAGHEVTVAKADRLPSGFALDDFDAALVGASIIMGRYQSYIRKFVRRHADLLNDCRSVFVSVNGHSPESDAAWRQTARGYVDKFLEQSGWRPAHIATFAGALRFTQYGPVTKWMMKQISKRTGGPTDTSRDYESTDWAAVDRFARQLVEAWSQTPQPA